jgi:tetratricopeptide (TPR) repeat protein
MAAQEGRLDEDQRHFRAALGAEESFAEAHNNLGRVLPLRGQASEAAEHFERALALNPQLESARRNLESLRTGGGEAAGAPATAPR